MKLDDPNLVSLDFPIFQRASIDCGLKSSESTLWGERRDRKERKMILFLLDHPTFHLEIEMEILYKKNAS